MRLIPPHFEGSDRLIIFVLDIHLGAKQSIDCRVVVQGCAWQVRANLSPRQQDVLKIGCVHRSVFFLCWCCAYGELNDGMYPSLYLIRIYTQQVKSQNMCTSKIRSSRRCMKCAFRPALCPLGYRVPRSPLL